MRKAVLLLLAIIVLAFKESSDKSLATVEQMNGLYIFVFSKPTASYDYLGSVKKSVAWTGRTKEMLNSMIKKVKNDYPNANAIIFTNEDMDRADAVFIK